MADGHDAVNPVQEPCHLLSFVHDCAGRALPTDPAAPPVTTAAGQLAGISSACILAAFGSLSHDRLQAPMATPRASRNRAAAARTRLGDFPWADLPDEELLKWRMCDLG